MKKRILFSGIGSLVLLTLFIVMISGPYATAGQSPNNPCSIKVPRPVPTNLSPLAKITADQAMAAAHAAYPGSRVQKVELENNNGCLVYRVSLSNGLEVKVDAGSGVVIYQEQEDSEDEAQENAQGK
jgi:hypothetical protein